jgi:hypothetical protein
MKFLKGIKGLGRVGVLTNNNMKTSGFCVVTPCIYIETCQHFGDMCCIQQQSRLLKLEAINSTVDGKRLPI